MRIYLNTTILSSPTSLTGKTTLQIGDDDIIFTKPKRGFIKFSDVKSVHVEQNIEKIKISVGKALAGGIAFGPAGAIVGGLMGKSKKKEYCIITLKSGEIMVLDGNSKTIYRTINNKMDNNGYAHER